MNSKRFLECWILASVTFLATSSIALSNSNTSRFVPLPGEICVADGLSPFLLEVKRELGTGQKFIRLDDRSDWSQSRGEAHQLLDDDYVYVFSGEVDFRFTRLALDGSVEFGECVDAAPIYSALYHKAQQEVEASRIEELSIVNRLLDEAESKLNRAQKERTETANRLSTVESDLERALLELDQTVEVGSKLSSVEAALVQALLDLEAGAEAQAHTQAKLDEALFEISRSQDQVRSLERQLAARQDKAPALQADLDQALETSSAASEKAADLELALAKALASRETAETERADLEVRLAAALAAKLAAEAALDHVQSDSTDDNQAKRIVEGELAKALEAKLAAEAALDDEQEALADAQNLLSDLREKLAQALLESQMASQAASEWSDEAKRNSAMLKIAMDEVSKSEVKAAEHHRDLALLNAQVADLRYQLSSLKSLNEEAEAKDVANQVQIANLGNRLNTALTRAAVTERRLRQLEEENNALLQAEKDRLETENDALEKYRSDFFGQMRELIGEREGVRIVGDRFVLSSKILFSTGAAELSEEGQNEIANLAELLKDISGQIPAEIDWIIRVDGHTDNIRVRAGGEFADNWELSQARALSVLRDLVRLGFSPDRLSANGLGEFQPIDPANTDAARAQNRRIEVRLTAR